MPPEMLFEMGRKARGRVNKLDKTKAMTDWTAFTATLGWYQWKRDHKLDEGQVEAFRKGFCGEFL